MPSYINGAMDIEDQDFENDEDYVTEEEEEGIEYDDADVEETLEGDELQELLAAAVEDGDYEFEQGSESQQAIENVISGLLGGESNSVGPPGEERRALPIQVSIFDLLRLLGSGGGNGGQARLVGAGRAGRDADDSDDYLSGRQTNFNYFEPVTDPVPAGNELLHNGEFGRLAGKVRPSSRAVHVSRLLRKRATRMRPSFADKEDIASHLVPNSNGVTVARYAANAYVGQFSSDSSFYYTCCQDFRLHIYDTTVPPNPWHPRRRAMAEGHETTMHVRRTVDGGDGWWTITDSHLSPDGERIIYSSLAPIAYMASTREGAEGQTPIDFSGRSRGRRGDSFGIMGCRFSADGSEAFAATNSGSIFVYDLNAGRRSVAIEAHDDDVNSCCWADSQSGNVLVSASDDSFLKVWDRRSLGASGKPAGVLVGHTEGITYVTPKGDGRYVASNGKDQAMRLWDLRSMRSNEQFETIDSLKSYSTGYDYRHGRYPRLKLQKHPNDCSVMVYRGHAVLRTLIRCHFSPAETTGSQYLYSASADGRIHIYSLDGTIVQILDRSNVLPMSYDPSEPEPPRTSSGVRVCVRDVSWHSQLPVLMSVGWDGDYAGSSVARHEWKGLSKFGGRLEDWVQKNKAESVELANKRGAASRQIPGQFTDDEEW